MLTELTNFVQGWLALALVLSAQVTLVLLLRKPVRTKLGAVACYRLWLLPLLWLPFYALGPSLLQALVSLGSANPQGGVRYLDALQQFMQFELLPFNPGFDGNAELATSVIAPSYGWTMLALLWLAGTVVLIAWQGRRWLDFSRQVSKESLPLSAHELEQSGAVVHFDATVPVRSFRAVGSAALFGIFKPVLLVPEHFCQRYDSNQRHIILAHEAVHLRRMDNLWNLCALLLLTLFWINPLVFIAWRYFRLDQELSCDALALMTCNNEQQKRYARTLLDSLGSLTTNRSQPALSAWDDLRDIKERSLMIKQHLQTATRPVATQFGLLSLAILGASLTAACAELVNPVAQTAEPAQRTPAAQQAIQEAEPETEETRQVTQQTGLILSDAINFLNMDEITKAKERLGDLRLDRLSAFERSRYEQLMFSLDMNDENYPGALAHLQAAIDSGGLNEREMSMMRYQIAQLYVQEQKYAEAAAALEAWIASEPMPNSAAYYLLAASHYYLNQFDEALGYAETAVELAKGNGTTPQEPWLSLLAALYIELEQFVAAEGVVAEMVGLFPDKETYRAQLEALKAQNAQQ